MNRVLRISRIIVSVVAMVLITVSLTCYGMRFSGVGEWLENLQFMPAAIAFSLVVFVGWLIVTLIFGRVYCSSVCPLGTLQDICARAVRMRKGDPAADYHYTRPLNHLRYTFLVIAVASLMIGIMSLPSLIDPYQAYQRIAVDMLRPAVGESVDAVSLLGSATGLWHFPPLKIGIASLAGLFLAVLTAAVVAVVSARSGRMLCNTVCPVGTTLGLVSRFAIFQIDIDTDKCIQCRRCEHVCKASCIDLTDHVADGSRCVNCFNCINVCPNDAIHYTPRRKQLSIPMMQRVGGISGQPTASVENTNTSLNNSISDETIS